MKKLIFVILGILAIVFLLLGIFFVKVIKPSILSVKYACMDISEEDLNEMGYMISGNYNVSSNEITIYVDSPSVERHEIIHFVQSKNNRNFGCNNRFLMTLNEIEAYSFQGLPDKIFYEIYSF
jgi:hypothetical protein